MPKPGTNPKGGYKRLPPMTKSTPEKYAQDEKKPLLRTSLPRGKTPPKKSTPGPFNVTSRLDTSQVTDIRRAPKPKMNYTPGKTSAKVKGIKGSPKGVLYEDGSRMGGITKPPKKKK